MGKRIQCFSIACVFSGVFAVVAAFGQSTQQQADPAIDQAQLPHTVASASATARPSTPRSPYSTVRRTNRADEYYKFIWGIDNLRVQEAASGSLLRFSYRVTEVNKAKPLNDKKATPYLVDVKTGAMLQIPDMPKVGKLRQTATPENGKEYWMVFSNKGNFVKPGSPVDVVIGNFRASGLVVQ